MLGLLIELENSQILLSVVLMNPNFGRLIELLLNFSKIVSRTIFITLTLYMFSIAIIPGTCILTLFVFQIWTFSFKKNVTWVPFLLILLSNDIQLNPGSQPNLQNNYLNFMNWNLNSLTKDNFHRVDLIEAHNSTFNYDLISVCETNIDDSVELPETPLKDFTFVPANHPLNIKHGGVGPFYKNRFAMFFAGDFNGKSHLWWPDGDETPEGRELDDMFTSLGLSLVIFEPTNFDPGKKPSCIDLIVTDQPNLILDSETRASLDHFCHHQIIYCKVNFRIPSPTPYERKIWHFNRANTAAIKRSIISFPCSRHLSLNTDSNWQVKVFTDILLNIMSNFVPNETKRFVPRDPPRINKSLKGMLNRKNRLYKNYKRHDYREEDKARLDTFRSE